MDRFLALKHEAEEKLKVADHLLSTTYPVVKEPKLLLSVIENIYRSMDLAMVCLLEYEKNFKRMPDYGNTFEDTVEMFRRKILPKYSIDKEFIEFAIEVKNVMEAHKKAAVAFTKKEKFIISDDNYNIKTLTESDMKKTLSKAKQLVGSVLKITST